MSEPDKTLKAQAVRGAVWGFIEAVGLRGVQFVIGIILARLLVPEQFGLIGMLTIFMALSWTFMDSGFGAALIQKQTITEEDKNSIFYFNILIGITICGSLCLAAPWVAVFYDQPILTSLLRVMSIVIVINSLGMVQGNLLIKEIDFKTQTKISLIGSILSGIIGVTMAYHGFGVWSLVVQQLSNATFRVILLWVFNSWRPAWMFSMDSLRQMFGFGSKMLCSGLLNTGFEQIYVIVIGKMFSPAALGLYTRANNLKNMPSWTLCAMVGRVTFPVFSKIQDDPERVKRGMKKSLTSMVMINFPVMIGLTIIAYPMVLVLLTNKWEPCIPYLQVLCLTGLMLPLNYINLSVLRALGRSDLFLRLEVLSKIFIIINIIVTWRWGIMAMISGQVVVSILSYGLNVYYNKILVNYSMREQIKDLYPYLINALLMGLAVCSVIFLPIKNLLVLLICQLAAGLIVYPLLCRCFRLPAYMEIEQIVLDRLPFLKMKKEGG